MKKAHMIPRSELSWQVTWQQELQQLFTHPQTLLAEVGLDDSWLPMAQKAAALFPLRATRPFVSRIEKGNPHDPLLRQILPLGDELDSPPHFQTDPLQEAHFNPVPGIIHKYKHRVLLLASSQCAIHCRYCFRRSFPYENNRLTQKHWQAALDYIAKTPALNEVILSGGDPLSLGDSQLNTLVKALAEIPHLKRVRIHTRLPIMVPSRITQACIESFAQTRLKPIMVIHCNHANELDSNVKQALRVMHSTGVTLLNQTVLLRGVNDTVEQLITLSESLFESSVLPYYLHLLDPVSGAAHFDVSEEEAQCLMRTIMAKLPGFLVPKLVREIPDRPSKTPICVITNPGQ